MRPNTSIRLITLLLTGLFCTLAGAASADDSDDYLIDKDFKPGKKWQEEGLILPNYPKQKNLVKMQIPHARYTYYIDTNSIALGKSDRVSRYTVVIESPTKVRSIYYEGLQCHERLVKQYAYAVNNKKEFKSLSRSDWRAINGNGVFRYRLVLADEVFCQDGTMRTKKKDVVQVLKYPPDNHAPEDLD